MTVSSPPAGIPRTARRRRLRVSALRAPRGPREIAAFVLVLVLVSAFLRTRAVGAPLWADEGIAQGIGSHSFGGVLEALQKDGSPPLYYLILHVWMQVFGDSETALHALSLVFALAAIPAALWAGTILFGPSAGLIAATLAAVNPYLSSYAQEARMYTLLALLGLIAAAAFARAFEQRDRRFVWGFGVALTAMAYTHNWGLVFGAGSAIVLLVLARRAQDGRPLLLDGVRAFGLAAVLYLPWLPTLIGQSLQTGAPWASRPSVAAPLTLTQLFGGASVTVALAVGALAAPFAAGRRPDGRWVRPALVLLGVAGATLLLAWVASQLSPAWTPRYFATVLGALLLAAAAGLANAGRLGLLALALVVALSLARPDAGELANKSNADVVAAELGGRLRPGDHVLSLQAEQVPLLRYYLPPGLRYSDPRGPVDDPRVMDWRDALDDLRAADPAPRVAELLRRVPPGGQVLFVAPITEVRRDWRAPWTELVRRRSAQWGRLLERAPGMRAVAVAPRFERQALTVGLRAVLYRRTGG